jgi:hypothetical protein
MMAGSPGPIRWKGHEEGNRSGVFLWVRLFSDDGERSGGLL